MAYYDGELRCQVPDWWFENAYEGLSGVPHIGVGQDGVVCFMSLVGVEIDVVSPKSDTAVPSSIKSGSQT